MIVHSSKNPIILKESRRWQYKYAEKFGIDPSDVKSSAKLNGRDYDKLENKGLQHLKDQEKGNKIYAGKGKPVSGGKEYYKPTNLVAGQRMTTERITVPEYIPGKEYDKTKPKDKSFGLINLNRRVDSHAYRDSKENRKKLISELININSLPENNPEKIALKKYYSTDDIKRLIDQQKKFDKNSNNRLPKEFKQDPGEEGILQK